MLNYDAILFDVDGTLIDSAPGIINTLKEVFDKMGVDTTHVNLRRYLGPPLRKSFGEHFTDPALIEKATNLYRESYAVKGSHECAAYPGAAEMLQHLKAAGLILCTVENDRGQCFASCSEEPRDGMVIYTHTERLRRHRKLIIELLLAAHCRDCTTCMKSGECVLQDLAHKMGVREVRFQDYKEHKPDRKSTRLNSSHL